MLDLKSMAHGVVMTFAMIGVAMAASGVLDGKHTGVINNVVKVTSWTTLIIARISGRALARGKPSPTMLGTQLVTMEWSPEEQQTTCDGVGVGSWDCGIVRL